MTIKGRGGASLKADALFVLHTKEVSQCLNT